MTLTKDKIIEIIRQKTQFQAPEAKNLVETLLESVKAKLEVGEEVKISGFGKWVVRRKRTRPGRNPHTGQRIEITARKVVTFHPSETFRVAIDRGHLDQHQGSMAGSDNDNYDE